ncbi:hypothetical protein SOVF_048460 [Spinacia oleracea]|nr:hypothetical protein SOVF_048460 [Spinacia oleracea]
MSRICWGFQLKEAAHMKRRSEELEKFNLGFEGFV